MVEIAKTNPRALGVHHRVNLADLRKKIPPPMVLQGNLDPEIMSTDAETAAKNAVQLLESMKNDPAHIMNLGHGIRPTAKVECMEALVHTVTHFRSPA